MQDFVHQQWVLRPSKQCLGGGELRAPTQKWEFPKIGDPNILKGSWDLVSKVISRL